MVDVAKIIIKRVDRLEDRLTREIKENRKGISNLKESSSDRKLACTKEFASKSYVRKSILIILVLVAFCVTEPELLARAIKGLIRLFS